MFRRRSRIVAIRSGPGMWLLAARLQALVDRELSRLRVLEETLRVQYEEPERAEAQVMALAAVTPEEMQLLHAEQIHEQSYLRAATALSRHAARLPRRAGRLGLERTTRRPSEPVKTSSPGSAHSGGRGGRVAASGERACAAAPTAGWGDPRRAEGIRPGTER